jgi:predicted transcriptional regulator
MKRLFESEPITVNFKVSPDVVELIDRYAIVTQTSRSWVIRAALETLFAQTPRPDLRRQDMEAAE